MKRQYFHVLLLGNFLDQNNKQASIWAEEQFEPSAKGDNDTVSLVHQKCVFYRGVTAKNPLDREAFDYACVEVNLDGSFDEVSLKELIKDNLEKEESKKLPIVLVGVALRGIHAKNVSAISDFLIRNRQEGDFNIEKFIIIGDHPSTLNQPTSHSLTSNKGAGSYCEPEVTPSNLRENEDNRDSHSFEINELQSDESNLPLNFKGIQPKYVGNYTKFAKLILKMAEKKIALLGRRQLIQRIHTTFELYERLMIVPASTDANQSYEEAVNGITYPCNGDMITAHGVTHLELALVFYPKHGNTCIAIKQADENLQFTLSEIGNIKQEFLEALDWPDKYTNLPTRYSKDQYYYSRLRIKKSLTSRDTNLNKLISVVGPEPTFLTVLLVSLTLNANLRHPISAAGYFALGIACLSLAALCIGTGFLVGVLTFHFTGILAASVFCGIAASVFIASPFFYPFFSHRRTELIEPYKEPGLLVPVST